jgi:predicted nucleic acid-binding protein
MPVIVSDTSPIRALDFLAQLPLLARMFDSVLMPPAVRDELLTPRRRFRAISLEEIPGACLRAPTNRERVEELSRELQLGECEAIALAEEIPAKLLIDERAGRMIAKKLGIPLTGVIGILIEAKSRGMVPAVLPLLTRLRADLGFFLSDEVMDDVRRLCNE